MDAIISEFIKASLPGYNNPALSQALSPETQALFRLCYTHACDAPQPALGEISAMPIAHQAMAVSGWRFQTPQSFPVSGVFGSMQAIPRNTVLQDAFR
ncbi:MAG: hypothetical protein WA954_06870 [Parerythrobacter sp.]